MNWPPYWSIRSQLLKAYCFLYFYLQPISRITYRIRSRSYKRLRRTKIGQCQCNVERKANKIIVRMTNVNFFAMRSSTVSFRFSILLWYTKVQFILIPTKFLWPLIIFYYPTYCFQFVPPDNELGGWCLLVQLQNIFANA